jgi:hypothetical protein
VSQEKSRNPLIAALVSEDLDEISKYITDDEIKDIDIYREDIVFELKGDLMGDLSSLYDTLNYYKSDADNAYEMLWDRMSNEDSDYIKDVLEHYFKIYYEQNSEDLKSDFGYMTYDDFKNDHYENFVENGNLWDEYSSIYVDKNEQHLRAESQSRVDEITKYIDIENRYRGDSTVNVNIAFLILFLIKNNYSVIDGKDTYFSDVMSDYISSNNLDSEYEGIWDHQVDEVTYEEFKEDIESYFEGVLTDMESIKKCATYRKTFNDIVQKVFKGGTYLDTDDFTIRLNSNKIDCGDGTVEIFYTNKKSNENYRGKYKVENLAALVTNYKLFENTIRFKNIIK